MDELELTGTLPERAAQFDINGLKLINPEANKTWTITVDDESIIEIQEGELLRAFEKHDDHSDIGVLSLYNIPK